MDVKFNDFDCTVQVGHYNNHRKALTLYDKEDGCPVATATVNLPHEFTELDEIVIKDYSENEGIYKALLNANIILPAHRKITSGMVECPVSYLAPQSSLTL